VARAGWQLLEEIDGAARLGAGEVLADFVRPDLATRGAVRGLGFDIPAAEGSLAGERIGKGGPRGAFGHMGFTGCSLWVDLDRRLSVALLSNRVYPTRKNVEPMRAFRPRFHDLVVEKNMSGNGVSGGPVP
jgi:CubicO group peptidase (beta-lactamase class C family)